MNDSVQTKEKTYKCLVRVYADLTTSQISKANAIQNLDVVQGNPTRVPRRADLQRNKTIIAFHCQKADENTQKEFFASGIPKPAFSLANQQDTEINSDENGLKVFTDLVVEMTTSSGTYVKEFVHSDQGRTYPSLISILEVPRADVLALDVLKVHCDWPIHEES